jgi:hypothetical protein
MIAATLKIFMWWTPEKMLREVIVGFLNFGSRLPNPPTPGRNSALATMRSGGFKGCSLVDTQLARDLYSTEKQAIPHLRIVSSFLRAVSDCIPNLFTCVNVVKRSELIVFRASLPRPKCESCPRGPRSTTSHMFLLAGGEAVTRALCSWFVAHMGSTVFGKRGGRHGIPMRGIKLVQISTLNSISLLPFNRICEIEFFLQIYHSK